jgi:hypothetical protein
MRSGRTLDLNDRAYFKQERASADPAFEAVLAASKSASAEVVITGRRRGKSRRSHRLRMIRRLKAMTCRT